MPLLENRVDCYNRQLWICYVRLLRKVLWGFKKTPTDEMHFL